MKYHVNDAGNVDACRARIRCRLGGPSDHFSSAEAARTAVEEKFAAIVPQTFGKLHEMPMNEARRRTEVQRQHLANSPALRRLVPRDGQYEQYYASTDAKHFTDRTSPGSKFLDPSLKNIEDVLALTFQQRDSLRGDDREKIIALGADPEAFGDKFRYLLVKTRGSLGGAPLNSFPSGTSFRAETTKVGGKVSLVADVYEKPEVDYAVVVMGRPHGVDRDVVITTHPGAPSRSTGSNTFEAYEGQTLTANEIRRIAGTDQVTVNTKVIPRPVSVNFYDDYEYFQMNSKNN